MKYLKVYWRAAMKRNNRREDAALGLMVCALAYQMGRHPDAPLVLEIILGFGIFLMVSRLVIDWNK